MLSVPAKLKWSGRFLWSSRAVQELNLNKVLVTALKDCLRGSPIVIPFTLFKMTGIQKNARLQSSNLQLAERQ